MVKPVIALVGRPNVGKSTLFNRLTKSRDALVADFAGLTRDRKFGDGQVGDRPYIVVDTGGLTWDAQGVEAEMAHQSWLAVEQADIVLFLVDARDGLTVTDQQIAQRLRVSNRKIVLVVNKIDGVNEDVVTADFYSLGLGEPQAIAASQNRGILNLMEYVFEHLPSEEITPEEAEDKGIKIAVVGRPNVGKSTLVNRMLGEERVVVFDLPGTTRDSIYLPFERDGQLYTLIDTAGVRRRGRIDEAVEKFSVIKTLQAIQDANVVLMLLDGSETVSEQDASLLGYILEAGRAMVVAVNKWDGLDVDQKDKIRRELDLRLPFIGFAEMFFISALHGSGVGELYPAIKQAYENATRKLSTPYLTRVLNDIVSSHTPPLVRGRRIKLRYAHQGGQNPPIIVIHGNQTSDVPASYMRYLINSFRKVLELEGTPLRIEFRGSENPFAGRRNTLTPRQVEKKRRLVRHQKKKR